MAIGNVGHLVTILSFTLIVSFEISFAFLIYYRLALNNSIKFQQNSCETVLL
jgi:hypothetical protein